MKRTRIKRPSASRHGTSLVEVVVSSLLVAVVLVTSLRSTAVIHSSTAQADRRIVLEIAANSLLEELRALPYSEPDGSTVIGLDADESHADRNTWDDCDDAHQFTTSSLQKRDGTPWGDGDISAEITVAWLDPVTLVTSTEETGLKRVQIQIGVNAQQVVTVTSLFSNTPLATEDWSGLVQLSIKLNDGSDLYLSASPRNRATISNP